MRQHKRVFESIHFFLIGLVMVLEGTDELSKGFFIGITMLVFGAGLLSYFLYVQVKKKEEFSLKITAHLFEIVVLVMTSYVLSREGKVYLPYVNLFAALGLSGAVTKLIIKRRRDGKRDAAT